MHFCLCIKQATLISETAFRANDDDDDAKQDEQTYAEEEVTEDMYIQSHEESGEETEQSPVGRRTGMMAWNLCLDLTACAQGG